MRLTAVGFLDVGRPCFRNIDSIISADISAHLKGFVCFSLLGFMGEC